MGLEQDSCGHRDAARRVECAREALGEALLADAVVVDEHDRLRRGNGRRAVDGFREAVVACEADHLYVGEAPREHLRRPVGRTVVDDDHL